MVNIAEQSKELRRTRRSWSFKGLLRSVVRDESLRSAFFAFALTRLLILTLFLLSIIGYALAFKSFLNSRGVV